MILKTKPDYYAFKTPNSKYRLFCYKVIKYKNYFDNLIMIVIIANIVVMCMTYDGEPPEYTQMLKNCNYLFISIFLIECVIKIYGLGVYPYLYSKAN